MPDFGTAFSGVTLDRKVTHEELVRAIRFMVAALSVELRFERSKRVSRSGPHQVFRTSIPRSSRNSLICRIV